MTALDGGILYLFGLFRKKEVPNPPPSLIDKLFAIGAAKNAMPFQLRGWVNDPGLYVQLYFFGPAGRLEAGTSELKSSIAVEYRKDGANWVLDRVAKYEAGDWERLVGPTAQVAKWILESGGMSPEMAERLNSVVQHFKKTGEWTLFPKG